MGRTPRLFPLRRCNIAARCPCVHAWDVPVSLPRQAPRQHRPGRAAGWRVRPGFYQLGAEEPGYRIVIAAAGGWKDTEALLAYQCAMPRWPRDQRVSRPPGVDHLVGKNGTTNGTAIFAAQSTVSGSANGALRCSIGTAGFDASGCGAGGAGRSPASGAKAPQAPQLNPRPPDAEPARSAGGADAVGWGSAGASTPCDSLRDRVTTPSSNHARSWASVSCQRTRRSTECREKLTAELTARDPLKGHQGVVAFADP